MGHIFFFPRRRNPFEEWGGVGFSLAVVPSLLFPCFLASLSNFDIRCDPGTDRVFLSPPRVNASFFPFSFDSFPGFARRVPFYRGSYPHLFFPSPGELMPVWVGVPRTFFYCPPPPPHPPRHCGFTVRDSNSGFPSSCVGFVF